MKILYITNVPAPYKVEFLNELSKRCELTVYYERRSASDRDEAWKSKKSGNYTEYFCKARPDGTDKSIGFDLILAVKKADYDRIIISGYSSPSVIFLILYCRVKRIGYFIESDGGFNKSDKLLPRLLKKNLLKKAVGIFTTSDETISYYRNLGYSGDIHKYPFSSFYKRDICEKPADDNEKSKLRKELGIKENKVVVTVGRFSYMNGYGKGYDKVLQAAKRLNDENIGWYIIGGKPTDEFVRLTNAQGLTNVHYIDFQKQSELKKYYRASDVSVLMTVGDVWGLVINESMACGLPVITTDRCIAGIEMIADGENGYIVPVGDDAVLADRVRIILNDDALRNKMSDNNIEKIAYWTIENMAERHLKVLEDRQTKKA